MTTYPCPCGHISSDNDPIVAEAKAWHHAVHDHVDLLQKMSVEDWTEKIQEFRSNM